MICKGSVVRYTPNRLIFNTAEAMRGNALFHLSFVLSTDALADIYGQGRNTQKSSGYAPHPYFSAVFNTHNCIDKEMHGRKRRIVSQAFSAAAIHSSEPVIINHVQKLCNALMKLIPEPQGSSFRLAQRDHLLIKPPSQLPNPRCYLGPDIRPTIQPTHLA